jgi:hypothetical protein
MSGREFVLIDPRSGQSKPHRTEADVERVRTLER